MPFGKRRSGRKGFEKLDAQTRAITFYAEDGSAWPHFEPIVTELTTRLDRTVCYLTSSSTDPVLDTENPRVHAFDVGGGMGRAFLFQMLKVGVLVATQTRLGINVFPRSRFADSEGIHYAYVFHSMASTHMIYEADAFDLFDSVLCVGPYMQDEIRRREELANLPAKELVEHGYGRLEAIVARAQGAPAA